MPPLWWSSPRLTTEVAEADSKDPSAVEAMVVDASFPAVDTVDSPVADTAVDPAEDTVASPAAGTAAGPAEDTVDSLADPAADMVAVLVVDTMAESSPKRA